MKIDIEKLICFLMSDEVIENNIPESLKLGLKEQGYKYEDGKICPLQEPVSEDLEEAAKRYATEGDEISGLYIIDEEVEAFKSGAKWQKTKDESITEDLGEYINELSKQFPEVSFAKLSRIAVRVANWQKKQDQETIELAEDHAMLAGMEKMKDEMMAKAIDAELYSDGMLTPLIKVNDKEKISDIKFGDKVKIIIIKEDEDE